MSNPYIQFELDAAKKAPTLASALGVSVSVAFGGLTRMWLHVYTERVDTVSSFYLRSFFEADSALVGEALVELGFALKVDASTWQVRGSGRYTRISEDRREAGRKGGKTTVERGAERQANGRFGQAKTKQTPSASKQTPSNPSKQNHEVPSKDQATTKQTPSATVETSKQTLSKTKQNQALEPITDISSPTGKRDNARETLREGGEGQAGPGGAGSLTQAAPVEMQRAPRVPDPYRPPEEGESLESFFARYPWPVSSADVVHQHAMSALTRHCARTKQRVRDVREALTRERHGDLAEIDAGDERQAVAV